MSTPLLQVDRLTAGYTEVDVVKDVTLRVDPGEFVCIIGPNGAGKSTFIKAVSGLLKPRGGTISFDGRDVTGLRPHRMVKLGVGYVPQLDNVFPNLTVQENLEMGAFAEPENSVERLEGVFRWFSVLGSKRKSRAATLSGGQRQMLALGRAMMGGPKLLMLDEPSAGLAPNVVDDIFETIAEINTGGLAILLVEQNARRALAMAHRGYVLDLGRNRFEGNGADLLDDPKVVDLYLGGGGGRIQNAPPPEG
jgi:ABC-type branched-subunit amino acid transport system ATPase component